MHYIILYYRRVSLDRGAEAKASFGVGARKGTNGKS